MKKFFKLQQYYTTVRSEFFAGLTTFLAMVYILAVNPQMLGSIGGGLTPSSVFTATALAIMIGTLIMALWANLPIAVAPGMGLNAIFTYTVVFGMGYSYQVALTAVLFQSVALLILSFFSFRQALINAIPVNLKNAILVGIGLFITFIGLQGANVIVANPATLVSLGNIKAPSVIGAMLGLMVTLALYVRKVPASILIGIFFTTLLGIPLGYTTIPPNFSPLSLPSAPLLFAFDFSSIFTFNFFTIFLTLFIVSLFDTIGTFVGVIKMLDGKREVPKQAFFADALGSISSSCLGSSTVTPYIESATGIAAGGRTGLTSLFIVLFFGVALFLSPLFLLIPPAATAPALIFVGFLMIQHIAQINFADPTEGLPAFITILFMPFTYSIADGIIFGILSYTVLKLLTGQFKQISLLTWILFVIFVVKLFFF